MSQLASAPVAPGATGSSAFAASASPAAATSEASSVAEPQSVALLVASFAGLIAANAPQSQPAPTSSPQPNPFAAAVSQSAAPSSFGLLASTPLSPSASTVSSQHSSSFAMPSFGFGAPSSASMQPMSNASTSFGFDSAQRSGFGAPLPTNAFTSSASFGQSSSSSTPQTSFAQSTFGQPQQQPVQQSQQPGFEGFAFVAPSSSASSVAPRAGSDLIFSPGTPAPAPINFGPASQPASASPWTVFNAFAQPLPSPPWQQPQGFGASAQSAFAPPMLTLSPAEKRTHELVTQLDVRQGDPTTALLDALLVPRASPATPTAQADDGLCWVAPVAGRQSGDLLLQRYLNMSQAIEPSQERYADWMHADTVVLEQLRRQLPNLRFGVRLAADDTAISRQANLLTTVACAGSHPHRRRFALELMRIIVAGPDWYANADLALFDLALRHVLIGWSQRPDLQQPLDSMPQMAEMRDQAALLLVEHGVPLSDQIISTLLLQGDHGSLFRFLSLWSADRFVVFVRQWMSGAYGSFVPARSPQMLFASRVMAYCQRAIDQKHNGAAASSPFDSASVPVPSADAVFAVQSWLRAAASVVASHPQLVCARLLHRSSSAPRALLESAIAHLSWSDLMMLGRSDLVAELYTNRTEWTRQAIIERTDKLMKTPAVDETGSSVDSCSSVLSVLDDDAPLSSLVPPVVETVILSLMMNAEHRNSHSALEEMLRRILQFARDSAIELWPIKLDTDAAQPNLRCYPWAMLTRAHLCFISFSRSRLLPVARLLHECGVTVSDRGESFTHHLCAEGTVSDLKEWISGCPQFALPAGWLVDPADVFVPCVRGSLPALRFQQAKDPRTMRGSEGAEWDHNRKACEAVMAHATQWMRSVGALKVRRALLPHLIPDLHGIVIDYLMAEQSAPHVEPSAPAADGDASVAGSAASSSSSSAASVSAPDPSLAAELQTLIVGVESRSLSPDSILPALYRLLALRRLEEEERAADIIGHDALVRLQAVKLDGAV